LRYSNYIKRYEFAIGLLIGICVPPFALAIVYEAYPALYAVEHFDYILFKDILTKVASIGLVMNALLFFLFLRFGAERMSKGVLYACLLYLLGLIVYKFIL
jgi:Co/Zn/Cd efflux system component